MGDGDYIYAFQRIVMPIAMEFQPDLVIGMLTYNSPRDYLVAQKSPR